MKSFIKYLFLLLSLYVFSAHAKQNQDKRPRFELRPLNFTEQIPDSIEVRFWKENVSGIYGAQRLKFMPNDNAGYFIVDLPEIDHISMFKFTFYYGKEIITSNEYFAEPLDQVNIRFKKTSKPIFLEFSGKGATKYKVRDLMRQEYINLKKVVGTPKGKTAQEKYSIDCLSVEFEFFFDNLFKSVDSSVKRNQSILSKYSTKLDNNLIKFYSYEFDQSQSFAEGMLLNFYSLAKTEKCKKMIADFYFSRIGSFDSSIDNPWIKYSHAYILNTGAQIRDELYYKNKGHRYSFREQYENLKKIENTDLRDRLVTQFIINPFLHWYINDFESRDSCVNDAYAIIKSPILRAVLDEQFLFNKGAKVFNFSMPDTSGNLVSLNNLKGKVFLLDFWGEGCSGCAEFAKRFKAEIYPEFSENPDFKVVSVNIDKIKERRIKAMKSGKYTQDIYINLNTAGEGIHHPMLKYYHLNAVPFLLLVDKRGKVIAKINGQNSQQIIALIRNALNED